MKMHTVRSHQSKSGIRVIKTRLTRPPKLPQCMYICVCVDCMHVRTCVCINCV